MDKGNWICFSNVGSLFGEGLGAGKFSILLGKGGSKVQPGCKRLGLGMSLILFASI